MSRSPHRHLRGVVGTSLLSNAELNPVLARGVRAKGFACTITYSERLYLLRTPRVEHR